MNNQTTSPFSHSSNLRKKNRFFKNLCFIFRYSKAR